ncbi:MAG TPA: hypothetical protein VNR36_13850 [Pseudolysinimonas sp.]|nr:hypothetical protein [Pseudolysinimonas sp.]
MSVPAAPPRRRLSVDPRLIIGVALVLASVAGVVGVVQASDRRVTVYAAASTLAPGDPVGSGDLLPRQVALDSAAGLYLGDGDLPAAGLVATAVVLAGELVPLSALGTADGSDATTIVLQLSGRVSSSVAEGSRVDVWTSSGSDIDPSTGLAGTAMPPSVLAPDAVVTRVLRPEGIVSAGDGESVEVLVPRARIARLLQAIADGDALAVVPAGVPFAPR